MTKYSPGIIMVRVLGELEAKAAGWEAINPEHLWMGLCKLSELTEAAIAKFLQADETDRTKLIGEIEKLRAWFKGRLLMTTKMRRRLRAMAGKGAGVQISLHRSPESTDLLGEAVLIAGSAGEKTVTSIHLAQAILNNPPKRLAQLLAEFGCATPEIGQKLVAHDNNGYGRPSMAHLENLLRFGRDVTGLAADGKLDPLIGRRAELLRLAQVLSQKRKGNAILVGDAGVGKTCIVEGLAQKIVSADCAPLFRNKKIVELSMNSLVAGTTYRGDLEKRLEVIVREAESDPALILFMDEFHLISRKTGGLDPANIFKPALARGNLRLIGATTPREYEVDLARDEAFARRFEVIWIEESSREEAIAIAQGLQTELEKHHEIKIAKDAIEAAVDLSVRYLPDRRLPDKALDLLDQACAQRVIRSMTVRIDRGELTSTALFKGEAPVGRADIAEVLCQRIRIPYKLLAATEAERLNILEPFLMRRIFGQKQAMQTVAHALKAAYQGLKNPRRPIASFLFAGPTGVGKTETAKTLSEFLFGATDRLIRIDLSEFMEKHNVARLIGAPPGYIGSEAPGMLTAALRQKPSSVVLFDEIEKAHPDVLNVLLQILDEGVLTDGQGRKAFFRESVVVMTSNILPETEDKQKIGFGNHAAQSSDFDADAVITALRARLRPELLGRIHNMVVFNALNRQALRAIADREFKLLGDQLEANGLVIPETLRQKILDQVDTTPFGARAIERRVEARVAQWLRERECVGASHPKEVRQEILYSVMPSSPQTAKALLVLDLVQSTQLVCESGDTVFSSVIGRIYHYFKTHATSSDLLFLKCTGDGFLAAYDNIPSAMSIASAFLNTEVLAEIPFRLALHWGVVKTGPEGDPLGAEAHRVFRMESITAEARIDDPGTHTDLPEYNRMLASGEALQQMGPAERKLFTYAGRFQLKGFPEPCDLWIAVQREPK